MDIAIILMIIFAVSSLIAIIKPEENSGVFALIIFFILLFGMVSCELNDTNFVGLGELEIVSLNFESGVYGSFTLGSGIVESVPIYYAYTKADDGGYKILKMEDVILYEDDSITPKYVSSQVCKDQKPYAWNNWYRGCTNKRAVYVPHGTIIKEFRGN